MNKLEKLKDIIFNWAERIYYNEDLEELYKEIDHLQNEFCEYKRINEIDSSRSCNGELFDNYHVESYCGNCGKKIKELR